MTQICPDCRGHGCGLWFPLCSLINVWLMIIIYWKNYIIYKKNPFSALRVWRDILSKEFNAFFYWPNWVSFPKWTGFTFFRTFLGRTRKLYQQFNFGSNNRKRLKSVDRDLVELFFGREMVYELSVWSVMWWCYIFYDQLCQPRAFSHASRVCHLNGGFLV